MTSDAVINSAGLKLLRIDIINSTASLQHKSCTPGFTVHTMIPRAHPRHQFLRPRDLYRQFVQAALFSSSSAPAPPKLTSPDSARSYCLDLLRYLLTVHMHVTPSPKTPTNISQSERPLLPPPHDVPASPSTRCPHRHPCLQHQRRQHRQPSEQHHSG